MSDGYVILAFSPAQQKAASACAYSIKIHNPSAGVSMIIDSLNSVVDEYEEPFDNIIELPYAGVGHIRANDWQLHYVTPYDNTIAIDCHSLVKESHDAMWDYLNNNYEMCYSVRSMDFKTCVNAIVPEWYSIYNIGKISSDLFYFKKESDTATQFFSLAKIYMQDWKMALEEFIELQYVPVEYQTNLIHAFILSHMDIHTEITPYHDNILEIIDMGIVNDDLKRRNRIENNWSDYINVWTSEGAKLKIQNFAINHTIVYKDSTFITDEIYDEHRKHYRNQANLVD